ncbi:DUF6588 family protein [Polaribacter sp.]|uniref:DUF6588 family protein n=1 Tax=Polaribacter sp. TaxID=1920175 RepID=UPI003EF9F477
MKKIILIFISAFSFTLTTNSQSGIEAMLLANDSDRNKLLEAYFDPGMKSLMYGLNSGWFHTAEVHKTLGFDITIGLNASIVPEKDEIFKFADLNLTSISSTSSTAATLAGSEEQKPLALVSYQENGNIYTTQFTMPGGVKEDLPISAVPTPAIQVSVGLPANFEASLRLVPSVESEDVTANLIGLGIKKEITNLFGPMDKLPLHVAVLAAYTSMNIDYALQNNSSIPGTNQAAEFKLNSFTFQALGSLNFPIINIYGGLGYSTGSSKLNMLGTYDLQYNGGFNKSITDPINTKFKVNNVTTTIGARLSLGFFKIFGSYTFQEYNTLNAGIAFSFR